MSIKIMSEVWDHCDLVGSKLLLLLAVADHANEERLCWPSYERLAQRCRLSKRHTMRLMQVLCDEGYLKATVRPGRTHTNLYEIASLAELWAIAEAKGQGADWREDDPDKDGTAAPAVACLSLPDAESTHVFDGDEATPPEDNPEKVTPVSPPLEKGDRAMSRQKVTPTSSFVAKGDMAAWRKGDAGDAKGDTGDAKGDTVVSPEPSRTSREPPVNQTMNKEVGALYVDLYGNRAATPLGREELDDWIQEYGIEKVHGFLTQAWERNIRNPRYVVRCLENDRTGAKPRTPTWRNESQAAEQGAQRTTRWG